MRSCLPGPGALGQAVSRSLLPLPPRSLQELKLWVRALQPGGGSNLLQALRKVLAVKGLDSLLTVLGSW